MYTSETITRGQSNQERKCQVESFVLTINALMLSTYTDKILHALRTSLSYCPQELSSLRKPNCIVTRRMNRSRGKKKYLFPDKVSSQQNCVQKVERLSGLSINSSLTRFEVEDLRRSSDKPSQLGCSHPKRNHFWYPQRMNYQYEDFEHTLRECDAQKCA